MRTGRAATTGPIQVRLLEIEGENQKADGNDETKHEANQSSRDSFGEELKHQSCRPTLAGARTRCPLDYHEIVALPKLSEQPGLAHQLEQQVSPWVSSHATIRAIAD